MGNFEIYLPGLFAVYAAISVAFTSPGPNFLGVVSSAVQNRINGVFVGLGVSVGSALWALFASTGVTAIMVAFDSAIFALSVLGGGYLCWLGYKSLRSVRTRSQMNISDDEKALAVSPISSLQKGLLIQMTNPKSLVFWLAITPLAISPQTPWVIIGALVFGCFAIAVVWHVLLALMFSSGPARSSYLRFKPVISFIFGVLFFGLGVKLIYDSADALA